MLSLRAIMLLSLTLSGLAVAQTAVKYEWPRTFSGQPDFEFSKLEVLQERAKQTEPQGLPAPQAPTMAELLGDDVINPFVVTVDVSAAGEVSGTEVSGTSISGVTPIFPSLKMDNLPAINNQYQLDLTEFRHNLRNVVRRHVAGYVFEPGRYSLEHMLRGVTLQAVVTSPERYAVLNGTQYREGDSFPIMVWAGPSDLDLMNVMAQYLPAEGSMSETQAAMYQEAYEEAVRELAQQRATTPRVLQKQVRVPATVLTIEHRKVTLEFNGQKHELAVRFAY